MENIENVYLVGIGGIGMSALARYFKAQGRQVAGYDKTSSILTRQLEQEGIVVTYDESVETIPQIYRNSQNTLVIYTPAIPADNAQMVYFNQHNMTPRKRAWVLGMLSRNGKALCVAGTHGKTTTTTMLSLLLKESHVGCSAFLGGISLNFGTNLLIDKKSPYIVIEADEYDRSFHQLTPYLAGITATDEDHLDIYGDKAHLLEAFAQFTRQTEADGKVYLKQGLDFGAEHVEGYYSVNSHSDFRAENVRIEGGCSYFDYYGQKAEIPALKLSVPGLMNVENAVLAITMALEVGVTPDEIRTSLPHFIGTWRRFNIHARGRVIYIDDYAHHPQEIAAVLSAIRSNWPAEKLTVAFQPHLYSRTKDLCCGFSESLSMADEVILLDIYPAREQPIPGVTSQIVADGITPPCHLIKKNELVAFVKQHIICGVFVTMGAGDIDRSVNELKEWFNKI